jgi:hypothetical protein
MEVSHHFTIFADYFQFLVMDEASRDDFSVIWNDSSLERMLAVGQSSLCPGTLRNVNVEVEVAILKEPPSVNVEEYDHAVEGSFAVTTGSLVVMSCTGYLPDAPRITVPIGTYQALYLMSGIETITNEWESAQDRYSLYLWRGEPREAKLLKHWKSAA